MERKVSMNIYVIAFVISLVIFLTGVFIGTLFDIASAESISDEINTVSQRLSTVQLLILMESNSSSFCPVYSSELDAIDQDVENFGYRLTYLEEEKELFDDELKKEYFVLEAESYLLSQRVQELCGDDSILLINFYSNKDCADCKRQGEEILKARDNLHDVNLKLFSFDGDMGSPVAEALKNKYYVKSYPSIVINGQKYKGFRTAEELEQLIREAQ